MSVVYNNGNEAWSLHTWSSDGPASSSRAIPKYPPLRLALDDSQQVGILLGRPAGQAERHVAAGRVDAGAQGHFLLVLQGLLHTQPPYPFLLACMPASTQSAVALSACRRHIRRSRIKHVSVVGNGLISLCSNTVMFGIHSMVQLSSLANLQVPVGHRQRSPVWTAQGVHGGAHTPHTLQQEGLCTGSNQVYFASNSSYRVGMLTRQVLLMSMSQASKVNAKVSVSAKQLVSL